MLKEVPFSNMKTSLRGSKKKKKIKQKHNGSCLDTHVRIHKEKKGTREVDKSQKCETELEFERILFFNVSKVFVKIFR